MKSYKEKLSKKTSSSLSSEATSDSGSHDVTLVRTSTALVVPDEVHELNVHEYHLTAFISNGSLTPRDISLILSVLLYQIVHYGANFGMFLSLVELYLRLSNGKHSSEINDSQIRLSVTLSEIIIKEFGKQVFSLDSKIRYRLEPSVVNIVMPYLMSKRTYGSRYMTWRPEKFIKVKAVPVVLTYERSSKNSNRYSSYCKGYGEGHGNAHRQKLKPDFEIDGEDVPDKSERNLELRVTDSQHQLSNSLVIKYQNLRERKL